MGKINGTKRLHTREAKRPEDKILIILHDVIGPHKQ